MYLFAHLLVKNALTTQLASAKDSVVPLLRAISGKFSNIFLSISSLMQVTDI
jgi:hypothetical protein